MFTIFESKLLFLTFWCIFPRENIQPSSADFAVIEGKLFFFNFQFGNIRYSDEAPLLEDSIKSFKKYHILDTSFLGLKIKTWASYQSNLNARICPSSPTAKAAEKENKDKKNIILAHLGGNKNVPQKDLKLSEWMSYQNSLKELCLCLLVFLYTNIVYFGIFWSKFCLIYSNCWFYDHFFSWNHGTQADMHSLWNTKIWLKIK